MSDLSAHRTLVRALRQAGRRWRARALVQGVVRVVAGFAVAAAVAIGFMDLARFQPDVVAVARAAAWVVLAALALWCLVLRTPRGVDGHRVARYLEQRAPVLDALLVTAAEVAARDSHTPLARRLYQQATAACEDPGGPTLTDRRGLRRGAWLLAAVCAAAGLGIHLAPPGWHHGAMLLLAPWHDARDGMPYAVDASPGSVALPEGEDFTVSGTARGFSPVALTLVHRVAGAADWSRLPMDPAGDAGDGAFRAVLPSLAAPIEYYVEGETVRSAVHRVTLRWLPKIARLDHQYRYPGYTGLPLRVVEDATDIAAVSGTRVEVRVVPEALPAAGDLVLDGDRRVALEPRDAMLVASLGVDDAERYRIELLAPHGKRVPVTPDHPVVALADGAPTVSVLRPTGEARVTAVEEMQVAVRADDDVSLREVELVLSVNGGPEEVVALAADGTGASLDAAHVLHLEDRALGPGDLIAFHARASDGVVARTAVSDIHFMEVRPFDRDFSRGRSGGSRQGGAGQGEQNLAAQQRDLVIALFRLARDQERLADEERDARLEVLAEAQGRIRGRVEAIVRRLRGRALVQTIPGYKVMLDEMPRAISAMLRVEALLAVPDPDAGLPPAREALSHLQRADAAFREVQVASQRGGGGQGRADNNDLSRLFELEIDRFRNRYSQVQRAQAPAREQQVDETLRKLEELARRQRQEVERARRRAGRDDLGGRGAPSQQALEREMDELLRQLERLSRERPSAAVDAAREALQQAARAMREAGGSGGGAGAAREALDRLQEARESLSRDGPARQARELEQAARTARSLAERQAGVRQRVAAGEEAAATQAESGTAGRPGAAPGGDAQGSPSSAATARDDGAGERAQTARANSLDEADLDGVKQSMEDDARALREALDRIAGGADDDRGAARGARRAAATLREEDVEGRLRRSREELAAGTPDRALEEGLARALDRVSEQVAEAARGAGAAPQPGEGRGSSPITREQMRAMMRELGGLRRRLEDSVRRGPGGEGAGRGGRDASDLESLARGLEGLRGGVANNPGAAGDLDTLVEGIRALASGAVGVEASPMLDALDGVERVLDGAVTVGGPAAPASDDGRAPSGYDALVDEYYRRLARGPSGP